MNNEVLDYVYENTSVLPDAVNLPFDLPIAPFNILHPLCFM